MRSRLQKTLISTVIFSETIHVFCCVLPTVFSLLSLAAGLGMIASLPGVMVTFHDFMHHWEMPIIAFSGFILLLGWGVSWYSDKIDCHDSGCCHGECSPKKSKVHLILVAATLLFTVNLAIYLFAHRSNLIEHHIEHVHGAEEAGNSH